MATNFDDLRAAIPNAQVLVPGDSGYSQSLKRWSASCEKPASVVVRPRSAAEVSVALRYATDNRILPLAIRGGGHSTSGDSSSQGGMVIDLEHFRSTSVDPRAQTITFGGGCTWEDVNAALWEHRLATVGGTVADTGVGGLILGGGYGYLTGRHGLALDCLLSCEIVLAGGEIVVASREEHADLFWALRGAGPNFGIVTSFISQGYPQGDCWAGFLAYPPEQLEALIEFGNKFMNTSDGDSMLSIIMGNFLPPTQASGILAVVFYNGPQEQGERIFEFLLNLGPVGSTMAMQPYTEVNLMFNKHPRGPRDRHLFGGANFTLPLAADRARAIGDFFWQETNAAEHAALRGSTMTLEYHPTNAIRKVGVEDTAYANRGQFSSICITCNWTDETKDQDARKLSKSLSSFISDKVGFKGDAYSDGSGSYLNYFSTATRAEKVYGPNAPRLRQLKQKYDPNLVFQKIIDLSSGTTNGEH